jgi:DNA-binding response OmpR family regulator
MKLLLVEDEEKLAHTLKRSLETESFAVDIAQNGIEGYQLAIDTSYDCIILDVGLPDIEGTTLAKKLRDEKQSTPILMLTARGSISQKVEGFHSGADDYLVKPFDFEELVVRIHALLRRKQAPVSMTYQIDDLTVNPLTKVVTRGKQKISLSPKEYALLEYLIRHPRHVISKQQLIDHVWDSDLDPFSNTVDVYIGYVRNKIDKAFPKSKQLVKTLKGIGYKLSDE